MHQTIYQDNNVWYKGTDLGIVLTKMHQTIYQDNNVWYKGTDVGIVLTKQLTSKTVKWHRKYHKVYYGGPSHFIN